MSERILNFKHANVTFSLKIKSKVTIIQGDSATGKTVLISNITDEKHEGYVDGVRRFDMTARSNPEAFLASLPRGSIVFLDEEDVSAVRPGGWLRKICTYPVYIVLASRATLTELNYDYRDVYTLYTDSTYHTTLIRRYQDYDTLPDAASYACEDSASGKEYYEDRLGSVETISGNKSCLRARSEALILDGSAIGKYMPKLIKSGKKLYLPESFEYLLLTGIARLSPDSLHKLDYLDYLTRERFYYWLCSGTNLLDFKYSKRKLNKRVFFKDLLGCGKPSTFVTSLPTVKIHTKSDLNELLLSLDCTEFFQLILTEVETKLSNGITSTDVIDLLYKLHAFW